jgi:hypothetical protein
MQNTKKLCATKRFHWRKDFDQMIEKTPVADLFELLTPFPAKKPVPARRPAWKYLQMPARSTCVSGGHLTALLELENGAKHVAIIV